MNTLIEDGLQTWLATLLAAAERTEPVLAGSDDAAKPDQADGAFVRCVCEEDQHEVGPLWLSEFRIEICTPMLAGKTIADHRALVSAVAAAFVDANLSALDTAMQSAAGRSVTGWYRLDEDRDSLRRLDGYWQSGPLWRVGMQEI